MHKLDGILFDIDGTIWDSRQVVAEAWKAAIHDHMDLPADFDAESIGKLFGKPMTEIFQTMYPALSAEEIEKMTPYLYAYEHDYLRKYKPAPYAGMEQVLAALAAEYPLFIVTNGQKGYTEAMLDATGLHAYFKGWLSYGDTLAPKNVTITKLMEQYGITHTCYVGDTAGDEEASRKAGIPFIYCSYGLGQVEDAQISIDSILALPGAVRIVEETQADNATHG